MLTESQRLCVKATAPLLAENGLDLTRHFYSRLFTHHPELREIFNQGNQQSGAQQMALATLLRHMRGISTIPRSCAQHWSASPKNT